MKNSYETRGDMTAILLESPKYGSMETLISTSMLEKVKTFKNTWYARYDEKTKSFYASGNLNVSLNKRKVIGLHRWLLDDPIGCDIDHVDHDTLNNTNNNIRAIKPEQNKQNKRGARRDSVSGIRGVMKNKQSGKWHVELVVSGKRSYFGSYNNIKDAEMVAVEARKNHMPFSQEAV